MIDTAFSILLKMPTKLRLYAWKVLSCITLIHAANRFSADSDECDLIMTYDPIVGVGIYAGRDFKQDELLEKVVGFAIAEEYHMYKLLDNYVEGFNDTHGLITLGYAMIYNHMSTDHGPKMIIKYASGDAPLLFHRGLHLNNQELHSHDIDYVAARPIQRGEQIFNFYGDSWFLPRGMEELHPSLAGGDYRQLEDLNKIPGRIPGCPRSTTVFQNNRLRARRPFKRGEIVEVSRVLRIPESEMEGSFEVEAFLWRKLESEEEGGSDSTAEVSDADNSTRIDTEVNSSVLSLSSPLKSRHVLLLTGYGLLYSPADKQDRNVHYSWWEPSEAASGDVCTDDVGNTGSPQSSCRKVSLDTEIASGDNGADLSAADDGISKVPRCGDVMFVSFTATRDIRVGEELSVDIYVDPATGFRYVSDSFAQYCL